jgi:DMSO/TMAO reductase YedYZ molybdopterin-dependent catalytic subunit
LHRPAHRSPAGGTTSTDRRQFLYRSGTLLGALTLGATALGAVGRKLGQRFTAADSLASVRLPVAGEVLPALPATVAVDVPNMTPFVTPNADFYRIDTALVAPQVPTSDYTLRIHGMVDNEIELSFEELLEREMVERDITLTCVSNEVGGRYVGNARWLGTRLDDLLREAGVQPGADQVVGRSVDGFACGFPVAAAMDGRDALVVVGMNGEPLPVEHGFPVRLVVPGLYGYVSATKWLTEIEVTTFADFDHYWLRRGWAQEAPIKLMSRIDTPRGLATVAVGTVPIAGVAWAQTVGIAAVEVSIDDGPWQPAQLGDVTTKDTWRQWVLPWEATAGRHTVTVRATDADGAIQIEDRAEPIPDGASGFHQIVVIAK